MAPAAGRRVPGRSLAGRRDSAAPPIAAILGPTASGKSELAMAIATRLPIEILVADSRQLFRGLSVGTAYGAFPDSTSMRRTFPSRFSFDCGFRLMPSMPTPM